MGARLETRTWEPSGLTHLTGRASCDRRKRAELREAILELHEAFHPVWGQLFKAGHQNSRWAQQVEDYACLYTSHVSNPPTRRPRFLSARLRPHAARPRNQTVRAADRERIYEYSFNVVHAT